MYQPDKVRLCFDADAKQMQERYEVARVKTSEEFGEHSKIVRRTLQSIWCGSQTKDERKRNEQKRAAMSHISGYVLDVYLAMPKCNVVAVPNIFMN